MPEALPSMLEAALIAPEAAPALFYSGGEEGRGGLARSDVDSPLLL